MTIIPNIFARETKLVGDYLLSLRWPFTRNKSSQQQIPSMASRAAQGSVPNIQKREAPVQNIAASSSIGSQAQQNEMILADGKEMTAKAEGLALYAYVPSDESGVTIGRGHDMKMPSQDGIIKTMRAAGIPDPIPLVFSNASGLSGKYARGFLEKDPRTFVDSQARLAFSNEVRKIKDIQINSPQAEQLFDQDYVWHLSETKRIATKNFAAEGYPDFGTTNWELTHPAIRAILVDMHFRGDYRPATRPFFQRYVADDDIQNFAKAIGRLTEYVREDGGLEQVPEDRIRRRNEFLQKYLG